MDWSIRVYMGGDNDLDGYAMRDLLEMQQAPGVDTLDVLVQVDRKRQYIPSTEKWEEGRRFRIRACSDDATLCAEELGRLGEINTGDPDTLIDFINWSASIHQGTYSALVLWGHGSGWKPGPDGRANRTGSGRLFNPVATSPALKWLLPDFAPEDAEGRFIAIDDQARDALEMAELEFALNRSNKVWDLLAFDACSMMQLELIHMLAPYANWICGSQAVEPKDGWPYREILGDLSASTRWDGLALGITVVTRFAESYTEREHTVYSLVDTVSLNTLSVALSQLGDALAADIDTVIDSVSGARRRCLAFREKGYVDIGDFLNLLADKPAVIAYRGLIDASLDALKTVIAACRFSEDSSRPWRGAGNRGLAPATALSIYFPIEAPNTTEWAVYGRLPFHQQHPGWLVFLDKFLNSP